MALQDLLDNLVSNMRLIAGGVPGPGALINVGLSPDPIQTGLISDIPGLTRTTLLLKMLRFADSSLPDPGTSIADFINAAGQVLGGQAMPNVSVELPGPPVPILQGGQLPAQPSLGQDPTTGAARANDVLSGVPGIVGVIETGHLPPTPLAVKLDWSLKVDDRDPVPFSDSKLSTLALVLPVLFGDLGTNTLHKVTISVTGWIYVADPQNPDDPSKGPAQQQLPGTLSIDVSFAAILLPRVLGLFTWPQYGTEPTSGDSNPDDSSLLLMVPADSLVSDVDSVSSALGSVKVAVAPIVSLLQGPLDPAVITSLAQPSLVVPQLQALTSGIDKFVSRINVPSHGDYYPVILKQASAPSTNSPTRGGVSDLNGIWWDKEFGGNDYYHDHAKSWLWLAPPGGSAVIYRDKNFSWDSGNANDHGRLTLTTGDTCLAGIPEFRPAPGTLDSNLSPSLPPLASANAVLDGFFTNEHPPTSNDDWAWTDSVELL
jgi:hypothetical protein